MDDLHRYSLEAIYQMMLDGTIGLEDLSRYIREVIPNMEASEDILDFLETANTYIDRRIRNAVEDVQVVEVPEQQVDEQTVNQETSEPAVEVAVGGDSGTSGTSGNPQEQQPVEQVEEVVEEVPIETFVEEPEAIKDEYPFLESDGNTLDEARRSMDVTYNYCQDSGMTINDISLTGKGGRGPYITFEINNESKQMLDHLMSEFFQNADGISLEFMRDLSTKSEMFTIEIDPANMSQEEFFAHVKETFDRIYRTVETTRRDLDYEQTMPQGLKNIKDRFSNDDPDIGEDFTIGYVRNDGKDSYYIVSSNPENVAEYARSIGYDIKSREGSNVFEIETNGSVVDTKLEAAAVDLSQNKEALNIRDNGVSNLDIYGSLETDPRVDMITNFIETSNDPHIMCLLEIEIPPENPSQRIVKLKDSDGTNEVVVFPDGKEFDNKVIPKIIDTYTENNSIEEGNITKSGGNAPDTVSCQFESENNTTMVVDGYSDAEIDRMVSKIESKVKEAESNNLEKSNAKQKTIGTYQPNNNNTNSDSTNQSSAFVSMPVLFVICALFVLMIFLIVFAG